MLLERILTLDVVPLMVLLLPLLGFVVLALFGEGINRDGEQRGAGILACAMVFLAFVGAAWTFLHLPEAALGLPPRLQRHVAHLPLPYMPYQPSLGLDFIAVGGVRIALALLVDRLSAVMALVVTGVGFLIHVYSLGYMAHDEERVRYFSYLNLFTFFMLLLVLGGSLPLLFVGWEGVGLCSYLLIGFWYRKKSASDAGKKAFLVNRIGDVGLILGMIMAFHVFGSLDLLDLTSGATARSPDALWEFGPATVVALLLFLGACGKSAQLPLHVWLPDAMEGPTPVSALIHAATMVTAGVYLVARMAPLYMLSPTALAVVAVVGTLTAFMAATVALVQTDIKKVLAYSTVSQLGYMFLACGVGAYGVAIFHLFTHAFFKALLFLGSGSVIHALSGEQDMRRMGGLWKRLPWTFGTFLVGTLAIAGVPPLAGFFSKDQILASALDGHHSWLFAVGLVTAVLTAFYMGRLLFLTFFGNFRGGDESARHCHESPWSMLVPLGLLAAGSATAGFAGLPGWLEPVFQLTEPAAATRAAGWGAVAATEVQHAAWLPFVATATALGGLLAAWWLYLGVPAVRTRLSGGLRGVARVLEAKYYFDYVFNWFVARGVVGTSETLLWKRVDVGLIDGAVNGSGAVVAKLAGTLRAVQTGFVRSYALLILGGAVVLLAYLLWIRPL